MNLTSVMGKIPTDQDFKDDVKNKFVYVDSDGNYKLGNNYHWIINSIKNKTKIICFIGPSESGKSHLARYFNDMKFPLISPRIIGATSTDIHGYYNTNQNLIIFDSEGFNQTSRPISNKEFSRKSEYFFQKYLCQVSHIVCYIYRGIPNNVTALHKILISYYSENKPILYLIFNCVENTSDNIDELIKTLAPYYQKVYIKYIPHWKTDILNYCKNIESLYKNIINEPINNYIFDFKLK